MSNLGVIQTSGMGRWAIRLLPAHRTSLSTVSHPSAPMRLLVQWHNFVNVNDKYITLPFFSLNPRAHPPSMASPGIIRGIVGTKSLSGIVRLNSVATAGCKIALYNRLTMQMMDCTFSDPFGKFVFPNLGGKSGDYFIVALDPDVVLTYNALVFDGLTPK